MRKLRTVEICGKAFEVWSETHEENPEISVDVAGLCDNVRARISLVPGYADTVTMDTYLHEILHGVISGTGMDVRLKIGKRKHELEEEVVTAITPHLRAALKSAGWKEPKRIGTPPRKRST